MHKGCNRLGELPLPTGEGADRASGDVVLQLHRDGLATTTDRNFKFTALAGSLGSGDDLTWALQAFWTVP
jgi:hypothetical protein